MGPARADGPPGAHARRPARAALIAATCAAMALAIDSVRRSPAGGAAWCDAAFVAAALATALTGRRGARAVAVIAGAAVLFLGGVTGAMRAIELYCSHDEPHVGYEAWAAEMLAGLAVLSGAWLGLLLDRPRRRTPARAHVVVASDQAWTRRRARIGRALRGTLTIAALLLAIGAVASYGGGPLAWLELAWIGVALVTALGGRRVDRTLRRAVVIAGAAALFALGVRFGPSALVIGPEPDDMWDGCRACVANALDDRSFALVEYLAAAALLAGGELAAELAGRPPRRRDADAENLPRAAARVASER